MSGVSIAKRAAALRARVDDDPSPATRAELEAWLAQDPRHRRAYEELDQIWRLSRGSRLRPGPAPARAAQRTRHWVPIAAAAAAGLAVVALWPQRDGSWLSPPAAEPGRLLLLTRPERLADGTLVVLAAGARVTAEPRGSRRRVQLSGGAARFIVAPDPEPFVAVAGPISVTARESVFDIEPAEGRPRVVVLAGVASVSNGQDLGATPPVPVAAGQALDPAATAPRAPQEPRPRLGPLEVDGMSVADVLAIAERGAGTRIVLDAPAIGARQVSGRFEVGDARALARKLAAALDLVVAEQSGTVSLRVR